MGKGHRTCEACGIKERHTGNKLLFSKFPLDPNRCREWLKAVGNEELVHLPIEKLHEQRNVCANHFGKKDFNKKGNRLKRHAIPSINLLASPLTDSQLADFPQHVFLRNSNEGEVPSTSQQARRILVEPSQNDLVLEGVPSTSQEARSILVEPSQNERAHMQSLKRSTPIVDNKAIKLRKLSQERSVPASVAATTVDSNPEIPIHTQTDLTPRECVLLDRLRKTKCTLASLRRSANLVDKIESTMLKEMVTTALKNQKRKPKGRRWTTKNKISALAIFKRSPKAYRYLQYLMPLPSVKTLHNVLRKIPVSTGINKAVVEHLRHIAPKKDLKDKYCSLVFDEIALKRRVMYDITNDKVEGFEDFGTDTQRSCQLADHALVFMLQGIRSKFKQPIAFYFVKGTVSSQKLATIIQEIIKVIEEVGFSIISTICDQGPTNMGALKILKSLRPVSDDADNYFIINDKKVYIIYDVPHLFKSMRNNFQNYGEMSMSGAKAKWEHLKLVEETNRNLLYLSKITQMHVQPKYRAKMKVKYAAQMLSNTVAAVIKLMAQAERDKIKSEELMQTGTIIHDLDRLFDKTNGPSCPEDIKRGLRENVSNKTDHVEAWVEYRAKLETVVFRKPNGMKAKNVRCIEGYITTLKSLRDIWGVLKSVGYKYLNLRQLNQDSLENLFGVIRQHSPTNRNPTCYSFIAALKTSIISGLTAPHNRGSNCERDYQNLLTDFHNEVFEDPQKNKELPKSFVPGQVGLGECVAESSRQDIPVLSIPDEFQNLELDFTQIDKQPVVYIAGYIASSILKKHKCAQCEKCLKVSNPDGDPMFNYILLREWWPDKQSLSYPTTNLCSLVEAGCSIFETEILPSLHNLNICLATVTLLTTHCDTSFLDCQQHSNKIKYILFNSLALLLIRRQCQRINQKLILEEETVADINKKAQQKGTAK